MITDKIKHEVVKIRNREGNILYGILSSPVKTNGRKIIGVFCQVGLALKSGVGNQFKSMCDNIAESLTVLRFDQSGTGDSQGYHANGITMNEYYLNVMRAYYEEDTVDVLNWVLKKYPDFKIILIGQCGGCLSIAYAGAKYIDHVAGFIMIAAPVFLLPDHEEGTTIRDFDAGIAASLYFRKIFLLKSYVNLLKGKSDINLIKNSISVVLKNKVKKIISYLIKSDLSRPNHKRFNWMFWNAFQIIIKNKKNVLFIMPELDNETVEFNSEFKAKILDSTPSLLDFITVEYVPRSDHSLMFHEGRNYLNDRIKCWIEMSM